MIRTLDNIKNNNIDLLESVASLPFHKEIKLIMTHLLMLFIFLIIYLN